MRLRRGVLRVELPVGQLRVAAYNSQRGFQLVRHLVQEFTLQAVELFEYLALATALRKLLLAAVDLNADRTRDKEYKHQRI